MKSILLIFFLFAFHNGLCQKDRTRNRLGLSIPIILNHSEATFYRLGNPQHPNGTAISYGANVNYAKHLYKNIYAIIGLGYFRQRFKITRPFDYETLDQLGYSTESYHYNNRQLFGGLGYRRALNENAWLKVEASYNVLHSFRQKYINERKYKVWQVNRESLSIGQMIFLSAGAGHNITKTVGIEIGIVLPVRHRWNDDDMFFASDWGAGTQQIARNKFSVGTNLSCYYRF